MTAPGTSVSYSSTTAASPNKPRWLTFSSGGTLDGTAETPSGYKAFATGSVAVLQAGTATVSYSERSVTVDAVSLPADHGGPWRCIVYAPDGHYAVMDGLPGSIPTVGTPRVRLTDNGPCRAVVRIPVTAGIMSSSFTGWDDGHAEAVARGMEMTVEYRTPDGSLTLAFRGRIFEAEAGEVVTLTAYDRIMDLALFSDQYVPDTANTYVEDEVSLDRTASGSDYVYTMDNPVGQLDASGNYPVDRLRIDCLSDLGTNYQWTVNNPDAILIHNLPSVTDNGITYGVKDGMRIYRMNTRIVTSRASAGAGEDGNVTVRFALYTKSGNTYQRIFYQDSTISANFSPTRQYYYVDCDITGGVAVADPANTYVGVSIWTDMTFPPDAAYVLAGTTRYTTDANKYYVYNGSTWSQYTASAKPEVSIDFDYIDTASDITASLTVSGATVILPQGTAPVIQATHLTTEVLEAGVCISYFITNAIALQSVVADLIAGAGCTASIPSSLGLSSTSYYTSSTFDYLTCIHELIREADAGVRDSLSMPGTISVLPRHTVDENPVGTFSTDPMDGSEQSITSYSLTARWMAERATVAILAENMTSSGLPIALETDDRLMDGSLAEAISSPMRSVTTDTSSGTHALLSNAAGGKIVQLHTNVVEGSVTLAGYRPDLWDLNGSGEGGLPVALTVPEYGISDTVAIPTEMEIADGVTVVTLDNIRRADRSEVANSMGLTADAISSASSALPDTVWIFGRADQYALQSAGVAPDPSTWTMRLFAADGTQTASIAVGQYLKYVKDAAGYQHAVGVIPSASVGAAFEVAVVGIGVWTVSGTRVSAVLDAPKHILSSQNVHIDLRWRAA